MTNMAIIIWFCFRSIPFWKDPINLDLDEESRHYIFVFYWKIKPGAFLYCSILVDIRQTLFSRRKLFLPPVSSTNPPYKRNPQ